MVLQKQVALEKHSMERSGNGTDGDRQPFRAMKVRLAASLLLPPACIAGCGDSAPEGGRLRVAVVGRPAAGLSARLEAEATRPTLVARDGSGQIVPSLATSWRFVDDGQGLILRLRPVRWSNSAPLVASDVVASFRRAAARAEPAMLASGLAAADAVATRAAPQARLGVRAPTARVVELRLAAASPHLLAWLAEPAMGIFKAGKASPTLAAYSAAGPADHRTLTRRSKAALADRLPAAITIATFDDSAAAVAAFRRAEFDIVVGDGLAGLGNARTAARPEALRIDALTGVYGYVINSRRGALADPSVRRALMLAVDRLAITRRFGVPAMAPITGLRGSSSAAETSEAAATASNASSPEAGREAARRLLAAAGYSLQHPLGLRLLLPPGRDHAVVAEAVAADYAAIGVVLSLAEATDIDDRMKRGDFDLAVTEASLAPADDAALLARWRCARGSFCNPDADLLLDAASRAAPAQRAALLDRAEAAMLVGPPLVALFTPIRWALVARGVEGWTPNRAGSHPLARLDARTK